jgi:hypothetical protein
MHKNNLYKRITTCIYIKLSIKIYRILKNKTLHFIHQIFIEQLSKIIKLYKIPNNNTENIFNKKCRMEEKKTHSRRNSIKRFIEENRIDEGK